MKKPLLIKNAITVTPTATAKLDLLSENGLITQLGENLDHPNAEIIDAEGMHLLPGIIDSQVHFREPGLVHKEDIRTGSMAAAAGGVTTFFEMPNTTPPTTSVAAVKEKLAIADKTSVVNALFYIGANGKNLDELKASQDLEGCCGVKIFLGSSTGDLLLYDEDKLLEIFSELECPIAVHSEDEVLLREKIAIRDNATTAHDHPKWRDEETALRSTEMILKIARKAGRKVHVLHITTKQEMELLAANKDVCTVEVTPQHLTLFAPDCYDRMNTFAQMNPPIRTRDHLEGLWKGIANGTVDVLGSDHAPHTREEKLKGYPQSPSGMPGVQTILAIMLNHVHEGRLTLEKLIELLCYRPAEMYKLSDRGRIEVGLRADLTLVDLKNPYEIRDEDMLSKVGWTPFHGQKIVGRPIYTALSGTIVAHNGKITV